MDAMAAADRGGEFVLHGAALERGQHHIDIGNQHIAGAAKLDRKTGIEHVR